MDKNEKNKIVGLVMAYQGSSYGMNLQAFATQYVIEKLGYETEIIQIKPSSSLKGIPIDVGLFVFLPKYWIARKFSKKHDQDILADEIHKKNDNLRIEAAQSFRKKFLHNFTKEFDFSELNVYSKKYFAVLIGSDQCWLPGFSFGRRNTLLFVPNGVRRISYATSLAVSSYPKYCYHSSRKAWKKFDYLSVREEEGRNIIKTICGNDFPVEVVVDPTYLISEEEWQDIIPYERKVDGEYVLSFMLGCEKAQLDCIRDFADTKKLKLVSIMSNESYSEFDMTNADEVIVGASPSDFINLIRGASYVFTDSFHGIAFSIINKKQVFVFYRERAEDKKKISRNSRIDNILRMWGIEDRLIMNLNLDWEKDTYHDIDYDNVIIRKKEMVSRSLSFLKKALA